MARPNLFRVGLIKRVAFHHLPYNDPMYSFPNQLYWLIAMVLIQGTCLAQSQREFQIKLDPNVSTTPVAGRLIVFVIAESSKVPKGTAPVDGPFWDDPQPLFATDTKLTPNSTATINDQSDHFPIPPSKLTPGKYRAQARLDLQHSNSNWRREPGNLWSDEVPFVVTASSEKQSIELILSNVIAKEPLKQKDGVEWFETRSNLLSQFRGRDVTMRAGVILPQRHNPSQKYPVIYEVPGFGGDHRDAERNRPIAIDDISDVATLQRNSFRIILDPEGPNGHTLFADSENNGPCGQALVQELIPALEAKYPLIAVPSARLLRGHSSGGWSTLWLATRYPSVFGATWSSAPDPVDFRRFQKVDIYGQPNFYADFKGTDLPSLRKGDVVEMTIRQEARGEDVLGPDNTSAQQWDSWFSTFGPKNASGNPAALFDPKTGQIDSEIANHYRQYDISYLLQKNPSELVPIFRNAVRLVVGTEDSFYLNEAVALLNAELAQHGKRPTDRGYIKMIPGDHGSIFGSETIKAFPGEMLEHLKNAGHINAK